MLKKIFKSKIVKGLLFVTALILVVCTSCYFWIEFSNQKKCFNSVNDLPYNKVAVVLGTSKKLGNGNDNLFFTYRIKAAYELFKNKKVSKFILSGDNSISYYDEPTEMKESLLELGVPDSCLILDYAGFRTFDSMVRCKEIFGQTSITVISQQFHNSRALFIAKNFGINAVAYNAKDVNFKNRVKVLFREFFSRTKCVLDIYLLNTKPKFLGEKVVIT